MLTTICRLLFGYWRPATSAETDLRSHVEALTANVDAARGERDSLAGTLAVRQRERDLLADVVESERRRVAAESMLVPHSVWHQRAK